MSYDDFCKKTAISWVELCLKKNLLTKEDLDKIVKGQSAVPFLGGNND